MKMMLQCRVISALLAIGLLSALLPSPARAELNPLTLFQRCGRSPWVIIGEVTDYEKRFAQVRVIEVLKGKYELPTLRVVHRLESWLRESWEEKIEFGRERYVVLFLKRYDPEVTDGHKVPEKFEGEDMFASSFGAMGVFSLPEEGQEAYMEAVRVFSGVTAIGDPVEQEEAVLALLQSRNPHILQAGLEQTLARRLAMDEDVPTLLGLVENPREPVRLNALQILGQVAEDLRVSGRSLPDQGDIVNRLKSKVLSGESDLYRAEALKVVAGLGGAAERAFIERISKEDRSQIVRYEASRALLDLGG
jgi:hypothetical protein